MSGGENAPGLFVEVADVAGLFPSAYLKIILPADLEKA
jgi:hypothetical protein